VAGARQQSFKEPYTLNKTEIHSNKAENKKKQFLFYVVFILFEADRPNRSRIR